MDKEFILRYLPLFEQDMMSVRNHIAFNLKNPSAALRLVEDTEKAIHKRLKNPLAFAPYPSARDRAYTYYPIHVRNYIVFYVVIENVMEVRRFVYNRRNMNEVL